MDPNRHKLETILKLPTHRLLNYYRRERDYYAYYVEPTNQSYINLDLIKSELDKREHLN